MVETVDKIMTRKVVTCSPETSIMDAAKKMRKKTISSVVVVLNKKPIGIVTERDFTRKVVSVNLDAKKNNVSKIMTSPVISIPPNTNIYYANEYMQKKKFRRFPVTNEKGELIGIITQRDLLDYFTAQRKKFVMGNLSKELRKSYPI
ncbi:CBS domain-containing protein [Candidatus Woesearchaeota archaeon]|nr:CBS domain-containing protein [Candidatus Woesearchaeota archaeon]